MTSELSREEIDIAKWPSYQVALIAIGEELLFGLIPFAIPLRLFFTQLCSRFFWSMAHLGNQQIQRHPILLPIYFAPVSIFYAWLWSHPWLGPVIAILFHSCWNLQARFFIKRRLRNPKPYIQNYGL